MSVLNTSIDIPDYILYGNGKAKQLVNFNEMESITELVIENYLHENDAFPERRDDDSNGFGSIKKTISWTPFVFQSPQIEERPVIFAVQKPFFAPTTYCVSQHISDTTTPPPNT